MEEEDYSLRGVRGFRRRGGVSRESYFLQGEGICSSGVCVWGRGVSRVGEVFRGLIFLVSLKCILGDKRGFQKAGTPFFKPRFHQ